MSSIDLVILGMVLEKPQSAYDIQKDIEYHNFSRWTKISIPSVYKKVLQLKEKRRALAARKKKLYAEYRKAQQEMREAVAVKTNIDHLLGLTDGQKNKEQER